VKLNLYADQTNAEASVADVVDVVEVVEGFTTVAATTTCVATTRMEEEEVTTTEEVAEAGTCLDAAVTTAIKATKAAMEANRTSRRRSQTRGHRHLEARTSSHPRRQAGYRLHNREVIRATEDTEAHLECRLPSGPHGWAMHLLSTVVHHQIRQATTARSGTNSTIVPPMRF
jgi:hypothetical protein